MHKPSKLLISHFTQISYWSCQTFYYPSQNLRRHTEHRIISVYVCMCTLQLRDIISRCSAPPGVKWCSDLNLCMQIAKSRQLCQFGGKRLKSTLLLYVVALGCLQNSAWNPAALAHQPSHALAHPKQNQIQNHPREEPGFHHTLTHVKKHRIHAAMLAKPR